MSRRVPSGIVGYEKVPGAARAQRGDVVQANSKSSLPIVAIGASAGGLDAISRLFDGLTHAVGAAFIIVQHLDPGHKSLMVELLAEHTTMAIVEARDGSPLAADHVYIIPPGRYLSVRAGTLRLSRPDAPRGSRVAFDFLLGSLAEACGSQTVAVILSGTGGDGSHNLSALKEAGGFVIAQAPDEAEHAGMPRSAIETGLVDQILCLTEMPKGITDRVRSMDGVSPGWPDEQGRTESSDQKAATTDILSCLKATTSQDFSQYKQGTIERRIERRMGLLAIKPGNLGEYLVRLRKEPAECELLAKDLLINVTSFFRDAQVFETLEVLLIPEIIDKQAAGQPLRIWVAGCSTGEEAYSIGMVCRDVIVKSGRDIKLQVFASDLDPDAIATAREGLYTPDIAAAVSAERLTRFFVKDEAGYRVNPTLRADVVFTVQNVLSDPPFSRIDLVSSRNLLIYLNAEAQAKVIALFHFALREGGVLVLGSSETIGHAEGRFAPIAKAECCYRYVTHSRPGAPDFPFSFGDKLPLQATAHRELPSGRQASVADMCSRAVVACHAPAAVVIDRDRHVIYSMGPAEHYLRIAPGYASLDFLAMVAPMLQTKLRRAIGRVSKLEPRVDGGRAQLNIDGLDVRFRIDVQSLAESDDDLLLVCFVEETIRDKDAPTARDDEEAARIPELERELAASQAELQVAIDDKQSSAQEQKAINEEALSVNEEFQSTNEELMTSKEELQSLNEELTALNSQLQETLARQRLTSDDLQNVLYSTNVATLFLDQELKIRFFTPAVSALFPIIPGDVGRPLTDLHLIAADETLLDDAHKVISGEAATECEVATPGAIWFLRRIFPYLTHDGRVEGVVITFADITEQKQTKNALEVQKQEAERANLAKSRFLAAASHDLRQPLQSLTLLKELMVQAAEGEKSKQLLTRFDHTLGTISGMLNTLLDINQIEAGVVQPKRVAFPLADLFERMRDEFGYLAKARNLSLRVVPTGALVESDPRLLEQIIRNLLGNAIKYTETGKILLGVRRRGQFLRIVVGDTGIGIAEDQLQAIFEEFHQVDNEARERSLGLGLGLSIVQRLGRLLGHDIDVQSVPGKGSLFGITLPMRSGTLVTPVELTPPSGSKDEHRQNCKVVVVDDDPEILELLEQLLKSAGYIVRVATDAAAALALVAGGALQPEILLTDFSLPGGIDGLELLGKMRALLNNELPAIILTGDISTDTMTKIARGDCVQLSKPVNPGQLLQAIKHLRPLGCPQPSPGAAEAASLATSVTYVVDDDLDIRSTIREVLEGHGHMARDFASSEAFLAAYAPGGEGCLLVDAHLPGLSGIGLLAELRARGDHIPVILITGDGDIGLAVEAMRAGACEFIEKPVGRANLLASIARAIAQSHDIRLVDAVHERAADLVAQLTSRQREIMGMVLAGDPSKNIAADLGISQRTVENHRAAIMQRMGVKSLAELARIAVVAEA